MIRNAGGRATDDAIRSLVISHKLLGTSECFVIHHNTKRGMELFSDAIIGDLLDDDLGTASFDGKTWSNPRHEGGCAAGHFLKWQTIADQPSSVIQDLRRIHEHRLVPKAIPNHGYIDDVKTGRLTAVPSASIGGAA